MVKVLNFSEKDLNPFKYLWVPACVIQILLSINYFIYQHLAEVKNSSEHAGSAEQGAVRDDITWSESNEKAHLPATPPWPLGLWRRFRYQDYMSLLYFYFCNKWLYSQSEIPWGSSITVLNSANWKYYSTWFLKDFLKRKFTGNDLEAKLAKFLNSGENSKQFPAR